MKVKNKIYIHDELTKLHDWICDEMEKISQEDIDEDEYMLAKFRTLRMVINKIKEIDKIDH